MISWKKLNSLLERLKSNDLIYWSLAALYTIILYVFKFQQVEYSFLFPFLAGVYICFYYLRGVLKRQVFLVGIYSLDPDRHRVIRFIAAFFAFAILIGLLILDLEIIESLDSDETLIDLLRKQFS